MQKLTNSLAVRTQRPLSAENNESNSEEVAFLDVVTHPLVNRHNCRAHHISIGPVLFVQIDSMGRCVRLKLIICKAVIFTSTGAFWRVCQPSRWMALHLEGWALKTELVQVTSTNSPLNPFSKIPHEREMSLAKKPVWRQLREHTSYRAPRILNSTHQKG